MRGPADETVGVDFRVDLLKEARDLTLEIIEKAAEQIRPGHSESDARAIIEEIQNSAEVERTWHAPQIRFGKNSTLPFGKPGLKDQVLGENDIYFLDLGLVFRDHEGDVGRAFVTGNDPEKVRCAKDAQVIWNEVRAFWKENKVTGAELYEFAKQCAMKRDWILNLDKANGHRIADFPHAARARGSIEGWEGTPAANRWILEIQIMHPSGEFGAFYEDLLN